MGSEPWARKGIKTKHVFLINHSSTEKEVISALIQAFPQQRISPHKDSDANHEDPS